MVVGGGGETDGGVVFGLTVPLGGTEPFGGEGGTAVEPVAGGSTSVSDGEETLPDGSELDDGSTVPEGSDADESPCCSGSTAPAQATTRGASAPKIHR